METFFSSQSKLTTSHSPWRPTSPISNNWPFGDTTSTITFMAFTHFLSWHTMNTVDDKAYNAQFWAIFGAKIQTTN